MDIANHEVRYKKYSVCKYTRIKYNWIECKVYLTFESLGVLKYTIAIWGSLTLKLTIDAIKSTNQMGGF